MMQIKFLQYFVFLNKNDLIEVKILFANILLIVYLLYILTLINIIRFRTNI